MVEGKKILAVVPARGGSKGVPQKNIQPLAGIPLIAHTANFLRECDFVDRKLVSTDDYKIAQIAKQYGLDAPSYRPAHLSQDRTADMPVLLHALHMAEHEYSIEFEVILMLQPTSPLRKVDQIKKTINKIIGDGHDTVWTISATDKKYHPEKQLELKNDRLKYWSSTGHKIVARQQLSNIYHRNGIAYAFTREAILNQIQLGTNPGYVIIDEPFVNIDTFKDFQEAERLLDNERNA